MCERINNTPIRFLYRIKTYIGNLPIQHTVTYKEIYWLINNYIGFYSVLVTSPFRSM